MPATVIRRVRDSFLVMRASLAFLAVPGLVAFAIPYLGFGAPLNLRPVNYPGPPLILLASVALVRCVRDFFVAGKGTLVPWAPPEKLVTVGLYRYSRNPMYASVLVILVGWTITIGSVGMFAYTLFFLIFFHLRVVYGEEPWMARTFKKEWRDYAARVPRWIGQIRDRRS